MRKILITTLMILFSFMATAIAKEIQTAQMTNLQPVTIDTSDHLQKIVVKITPSNGNISDDIKYHIYYLKRDDSMTFDEVTNPKNIIKSGKHEVSVYKTVDIKLNNEEENYRYTVVVLVEENGKFSKPSNVIFCDPRFQDIY